MKRTGLARFARVAAVALALLCAAVILALRALQTRRMNRVCDIPILMYHNVLPADDPGGLDAYKVSADEFASQMEQLAAAGYSTVLPDDIWSASTGKARLPDKPVVITFDDGYLGVKDWAEPALARHGFRAICYVIADRLGKDGASERPSFDSGPLLTCGEAAAMHERGVVLIGSHSLTHKWGEKCLVAEILPSRSRVRELTGVDTRAYSYPFGLYGSAKMYDALGKAGFQTAVICEDRMFRFGVDTNLFALPRLTVYGGKHDIRVESVDTNSGVVAVSNAGHWIPLKAVVVREGGGGTWESEVMRVMGSGGKDAVFRLPPEAFAEPFRLELRDKAGLFKY